MKRVLSEGVERDSAMHLHTRGLPWSQHPSQATFFSPAIRVVYVYQIYNAPKFCLYIVGEIGKIVFIPSSLKKNPCLWIVLGFPGGASGKEPICQCKLDIRDGVRSLGWKDPLKKGMTTHSNILAWRIPWIEEPGELQSLGVTKSGTRLKWLSTHAWIILFFLTQTSKARRGCISCPKLCF